MEIPTVIWAALITVLGTVVLAPIGARLVSWVFERRSQLRVETKINEFKQPNFLSDEIEAILDREARESFDSGKSFLDDPRRELRRMASIETMLEFRFTNMSKKKIENITLMVGSGRGFYQREDEKEINAYGRDTKIKIGYLQPRHSAMVRVWSDWNFTNRYVDLGEAFIVSADEISRIVFRFPALGYLLGKFALIPRWISRLWWICLWLVVTFGPIVIAALLERK